MEKKSQTPYLTISNLLIVQDLWQAYHEILSVILPKEFLKLNVKMILIVYKCLFCNKIYRKKFHVNLKNVSLIHTNFLALISINLFCCCEKVLTYMNALMIGKNSMKNHYL